MTHQVAQKDKAPLEQPQNQQVAVGIFRGDLGAKLGNTLRDRIGLERDAFDGTPCKPRIGDYSRHLSDPLGCHFTRSQ